MRKHQKRFLSILTSASLLAATVFGMNVINSSAESATYDYSANYVSSDINCFTNVANPDNGASITDLKEQYQKIGGGANVAWYMWHNSTSTGSISVDTAVSHESNGYSIKYNGTVANNGALSYYWMKLLPGDYTLSFYYKGSNVSGASVYHSIAQSEWDSVKDSGIGSNPSVKLYEESVSLTDSTGESGWLQITKKFTVSGTSDQAVRFYFESRGKADAIWLSDFSVTDNFSFNLVSSDINNQTMFVNNDSSFGESNVPAENRTISGAANRLWRVYHSGANGGNGSISSDSSIAHGNDSSVKYTSPGAFGALAQYWVKLAPGNYSFSFWYKGQNYTDSSKLGWYVACGDWESFKGESYSTGFGNEWWQSTGFIGGAANDQLIRTGKATEWTKVSADLTVPGTSDQAVRFYFWVDGQIDALWLSDFSVVSKDEAAAEQADVMIGRSEKLTDIFPVCSGATVAYDNEAVALENGEMTASKASSSTLTLTLADGTSKNFNVTAYPFGDVNKSGAADIIDLIHLKKAAAGVIANNDFYNLGSDDTAGDLVILRKLLLGVSSNTETEVPEASRLGLYVKDGVVKLAGNAFYGIGTNYYDAFNKDVSDTTLETGIATIKNSGIPYIRARFSPYQYDDDMKLFWSDRDAYFARTDRFVELCEENNIGIIADIMWTPYPYLGRTQLFETLINNPDCVGYREMLTYIKAVVERYKDSKALWGWEISNELNLACDYNGAFGHLTSADVTALYDTLAAYIREWDGNDRIISNGNSQDFGTSYQMSQDFGWKYSPLDTLEQQKAMAALWNRTMSVNSIHVYNTTQALDQNTVSVSEYLNAMVNISKELNKPLFIGEYCDNEYNGDEAASQTKFDAVHSAIMSNDIQLACLWIYDSSADLYASPDEHTAYMLGKAKTGNETYVSAGKQITGSYWN